MAGLLQAGDLPPAMAASADVEESIDYDVDDAAFVANDGVRMVSRTWGGETDQGTQVAFDFRMQFPTPEAASAYLAAAMPTLSEVAATGMSPLADVPPLGDEVFAFGVDTQGEDGPVTVRNYLIRVGPVVAKVLAGGGGLTGDEIETMAAAAAMRMSEAGPPVPGSPRPAPTPSPAASPVTPLPSGDLVELLLGHVPDAIAPTCDADEQRLWEGEVATVVCLPSDADVTVTYSGFDTADHMGAAYQMSLDTIDVSDIAGSCRPGHMDRLLPARRRDRGPAHVLVGAQWPGHHVVRRPPLDAVRRGLPVARPGWPVPVVAGGRPGALTATGRLPAVHACLTRCQTRACAAERARLVSPGSPARPRCTARW